MPGKRMLLGCNNTRAQPQPRERRIDNDIYIKIDRKKDPRTRNSLFLAFVLSFFLSSPWSGGVGWASCWLDLTWQAVSLSVVRTFALLLLFHCQWIMDGIGWILFVVVVVVVLILGARVSWLNERCSLALAVCVCVCLQAGRQAKCAWERERERRRVMILSLPLPHEW